MQFSFIAIVVSLAVGVTADLHNFCICANWNGGELEYNESATTQMCTAYSKRNTGGKWWDTCTDCEYVSDQQICRSNDKHMGGDEVNYYCKQFGAHVSRC